MNPHTLQLAQLARWAAKEAKRNPTEENNKVADTLFVACVQLNVPEMLLPQ